MEAHIETHFGMTTAKILRQLWVCLSIASCPGQAVADAFVLPPADIDLVGQLRFVQANQDETLLDIARLYDLGQNEILLANPNVDRWLPEQGARVVLPTRYILPKAQRRGLVLNVPEMRLYYYPEPASGSQDLVVTYPVSIGRMDWKTPLGLTRVVSKKKDPAWRPPQSLKAEAAADGEPLPDLVPAGPDNPLGRYAMRLGLPGYLIHSTNKPFGVGMRVTHGCVRMYPEDIEPLFSKVPVNTRVQIVNQPIKLGWLAGTLFMEVHPPLEEEWSTEEDWLRRALDIIYEQTAQLSVLLDGHAVRKAVLERSGIPVPVSKGARSPRISKDPGSDLHR